MQIAIIDNNTVTAVGDYRQLFPQTSFPANGPTQEWMEENSCMKVNLFLPHDRDTEKLVACAPYIEGEWVYTVEVQPLTQVELDAKLTARKAAKCAEVNALRDAKEVAGFTYQGKVFQSDERSAQRIANAALTASTALATGQPFSVTWLSEDDTPFVLDALGMLALQAAFTQYAGALHAYGRSLKDQINAADTLEQIEAIDLGAGWPS